MKNIAVIGAGGWGLALALLLNEKGNNVTIWCYDEVEKNMILQHRENKRCLPGIKLPIEMAFLTNMDEVLRDKDVAILAVPSKAIRTTAELMKPYLSKDTIIVNVSKGIENETLMRLSEVINEVLPENKVVVLSGPSHAEEVARHVPTTVAVSSLDEASSEFIQELFMSHYFRVYTNDDLIGIEMGGALKNVIALAAGVIEGMNYGDNTKAALITRGIAEITRLGVAMGGKASTFAGLAGIGDLIVTCTSGHSRNRRAGELLGQGYTIDEALKKVNMVVEGVPTAKAAHALMLKYAIEMPIIEAVYQALFENKSTAEAITMLMQRDKKSEL
ncbi:NAD(P)H-dependent glycerol-3-phosphate dehydrogenase [Sporanaerobium hydrogeniformans]|uniref:NAD(P)H-dependent glycerol-3-phosphate dehydrogenase n=1 Tax=Sporanaerobium hydrogeniformans TaxID=3072179 RepID=A0AC61DCZ5_9FIRM|nr:NAD(P)H-dependent glycerol-3-phosphate dehydrogenase [Sporanaerobium hydrogeniformans]PHV71130.1 NAD(P)H-dependent glycerol-3-phosphate dehydrogenase [Sporanaerobium hydrogeniformans]